MPQAKIMIVEDEKIVATDIRKSAEKMGYFVCAMASSGAEAVQKAGETRPDLALMDIVLKGEMDGIRAAEQINALFKIPVVYLTAYDDEDILARAKITTPYGYIIKPFNDRELRIAIEIALYKNQAEEALRESHAKLERNLKSAIDVISETIERRGPYASGHHQRIKKLAVAVARKIGLTDFQVQGIELAATVYDIGLIDIPIELLQNTGNLEGIKLTLYQGYPQTGYDTLKKIEFPWPIADIILQHRECFDGSGFPKRLKGADILIEARVLAVADAIADLTVYRSYRNALPMDEALTVVVNHSGSLYDPDVVNACQRLVNEGYQTED